MDRQQANLRQNDSMQVNFELQNMRSQYFQPNPAPSSEYLEAKNQLDRWGNWVKFISVFMILKGLLSLFYMAIMISFPANAQDSRVTEIQLFSFALVLYFTILGLIGYRAGQQKTSGAANCYISMLIIEVLLEGLYLVVIGKYVAKETCEQLERTNQNYQCDENFYQVYYGILAIGYVICAILICTPMMWCPCKMQKNAKIVEKGLVQTFQFQRIPTQATPFYAAPNSAF